IELCAVLPCRFRPDRIRNPLAEASGKVCNDSALCHLRSGCDVVSQALVFEELVGDMSPTALSHCMNGCADRRAETSSFRTTVVRRDASSSFSVSDNILDV